MTNTTVSPATLVRRMGASAAPESNAREDRSVPVSEISGLFAAEMNRRALASGQPVADVDALASFVEDYAVKSTRGQMLALAKVLTARAKSLTADDVRILANQSGSSARFFVPGLDTDGPDSGTTGERGRASASVSVTPDPRGVVGAVLKSSAVSPRALPKRAK